jgi:hypothetical protein
MCYHSYWTYGEAVCFQYLYGAELSCQLTFRRVHFGFMFERLISLEQNQVTNHDWENRPSTACASLRRRSNSIEVTQSSHLNTPMFAAHGVRCPGPLSYLLQQRVPRNLSFTKVGIHVFLVYHACRTALSMDVHSQDLGHLSSLLNVYMTRSWSPGLAYRTALLGNIAKSSRGDSRDHLGVNSCFTNSHSEGQTQCRDTRALSSSTAGESYKTL